MDQQILANWLVQDLRPGEPFQRDFDPASRPLDVLEEMVSAGDISPKAALDVAVNLGRLLVVLDLTRASSKKTLEGIYLRALVLLEDCDLGECSVQALTESFTARSPGVLRGQLTCGVKELVKE